jgi:hypothetical protein
MKSATNYDLKVVFNLSARVDKIWGPGADN